MKTLTASTQPSHLITTAIFAALTLSCGTVSIAGDQGDPPQSVVKFADLNLANPQGAAALYNRIVAAAYDVCVGFDIDTRDLAVESQLLTCVHRAVLKTVTKVGRPELVAIYNARNRDPLPITVAAAQKR